MQPTSVVPVDVNSANVDIVINESLLEPDQADPGSGYTSLNQNEDNHNRGLSPNDARGSAWTSLERRTSTPSAQDFELEPINDRTGLTSVSFLPLSQQEDDTLTGGDASDNVYLQPPRRGFHNNPSNISSSSRSTGHSSRMSSVKLALGALGRASTRVINLSGSSQSQPAAIENASVYSGRSMEVTGGMRDEQLKQNRASTDNFDGASRTSFSRIVREEPIDLGPPPLQGKSLFIFGPDSPLRKMINSFLNQKWVELFLLLLIMINLVFLMIKTSSPVGNDNVWGSNWTDYGIMAIFILYTLEIAGRIIVCGLIFYPEDGDKVRKFFGKKPRTDNLHDTNPTILRRTHEGLKRPPTMAPMNTFSNKNQPFPMHNAPGGRATTILGYATGRPINQNIPEYLDSLIAFTPQFVVEKAQIPYLRHTFNRIDLLAVVCYWIDVCLMLTGVAQAHDIYFFKAMAAMRTLRLLNITPGSSTILHSLKRSAPLLANIFLFIVFFFIIFSIIGVQAFKGSFSRRCISREPPHNVILDQFCGGYIDITTNEQISYITLQNTTSPTDPKGYICPIDFICQDTGVNLHNTISFDTIYSAMVPVYVLMTGQTWTDLMYRMMDAEFKWSSLYFVLVVLVMNFWILNLFIAVINEMFAKIRDDSANKSAFKSESPEKTAEKMEKAEQVEKAELEEAEEMEESGISGEQGAKEIEVDILAQSVHNFKYRPNNPDNPDNPDSVISRKKTLIERLEMFWVLAVIGDLVVQCLPQYDSPTYKIALYNNIEFWFTIAFAFDIVSRFLIWIKTPREFFKSKKNMVDLFLAIVTVIIQVPIIHNSHVYIYLTVFQVVRIYRPIIYIHRLRSLIQRVVGSWVGLLNLIFFIALFIAIVSVMDALLFREIMLSQADSNNPPDMTFQDYYVSYLGTYQLFSGENWTDILYSVMEAEIEWGQIIVATVFVIAFYSFANFVLVNMLIAIIMENFDGEEEKAKHTQQILDYAEKSDYEGGEKRAYVNYLKMYLKPRPKSLGIDVTQTGWMYKMRRGLARDFLLGDKELFHAVEEDPTLLKNDHHRHHHHHHHIFQSNLAFIDEKSKPVENQTSYFSREIFRTRSLLIFGPDNHIRRFLQRIITPSRRTRKVGIPDNKMMSRPFNLFITFAILASVIVAAITTPVWRLNQSRLDPNDRSVAVSITDIVFPAIFTVEFIMRIIADGFIFTPDAYLRSIWNQIDFVVLLSLYVPLMTSATSSQGYSRFFRSLKSLRALRLINQSAYIKGTFHAVLVAGFPQLLNAGMLSIALIVPFAIYGMRLFSGEFFSCNDGSNNIVTLSDCSLEYSGSGSGTGNMTMPRVWSNPPVYSFDNFFASFLILFEIVSQEGWIGVMATARNIVGLGLNSNTDSSRYNAIYFVIFNLAGGYFVTSLFVAVVIENYTKRTGTAFMTANQRQWMDLKKLLGGIKMSKTKANPPRNPIRAFCFRITSPKRGWFPRLLTFITLLNGIALMSEHINSGSWEGVKNWIFLILLLFYMFEIFAKISGLGWAAFTRNRWNIYNSVVSICALVITLARITGSTRQALIQTQKLFLTAILFRLVPQINSLNQLFTTMAASIKSIASLFAVWLVVFAVYGIMFTEIFGLTSYGLHGGLNINFRNIGTTFLMMARMSTGEGWNDLMHDFAVERPNCFDQPDNYLESDCGSTGWAYSLFISFNIISMYIFTNMFIVVVMHNFSYVYQIAPGFSLINREEIRGFKKVWGSVDPEKTGYIHEEHIIKFLMSLRGVFDMRIYKDEHSIINLQEKLETAKPNAVKLSAKELEKLSSASGKQARRVMLNQTSRRSTMNPGAVAGDPTLMTAGNNNKTYHEKPDLSFKLDREYNLAAFNSAFANVDKEEVRRRRRLFNFVYAEAVMSMDPIPGTESTSRRRNRFFPWWSSSRSSSRGSPSSLPGSEDHEMGKLKSGDVQYGISFQKMLNIVAHYKLIEDDQCFSIGEMLRHRQKMDRIHARVNVIYIRSVLLKMILRQRFLKHYHEVQRIQARIDDNDPEMNAAYPPGDPIEQIGFDNQVVSNVPRSMQSSTSIGQAAATDNQKRVRINTGSSQILEAGVESSVPSRNILGGGDKEELIDAEKAEIMVEDLRSEWRTFISNHDLSMRGMIRDQPMNIEVTRAPTLHEFKNAGRSMTRYKPDYEYPSI